MPPRTRDSAKRSPDKRKFMLYRKREFLKKGEKRGGDNWGQTTFLKSLGSKENETVPPE